MPFKKGTEWQGNKNGRPANSGHRQQLFRTLVEPNREKIVQTAIDLAISGNEAMLRVLLERLLPKSIDDPVVLPLPDTSINKSETLLSWGESILLATSQGELTPEQSRSLMAVIESQRKNIEAAELETRIIEIERTLKQRRKKEKYDAAQNK